jgi:hypothetical protein
MATEGTIGSGIRAGYSLASPHTWVRITGILDGNPPQFTRDDVDTTTHGVTSIRKEIPGLSTVNDATLVLLADLDRLTSPSHLGLKDLERSQNTVWFRYEVPIDADLESTDYLVFEYQVRVKSWELTTPIDNRKEINVAFKFGGDDVYQYEGVASAF